MNIPSNIPAPPPPAPIEAPKKAWYKTKKAIALWVVLGLGVIGSLGGDTETADEPEAAVVETTEAPVEIEETTTTTEAVVEETTTTEAEVVRSPELMAWDTFSLIMDVVISDSTDDICILTNSGMGFMELSDFLAETDMMDMWTLLDADIYDDIPKTQDSYDHAYDIAAAKVDTRCS